jgi:hypothetical protein
VVEGSPIGLNVSTLLERLNTLKTARCPVCRPPDATPLRTPWRFKSSHPHSDVSRGRGPVLACSRTGVVPIAGVDGVEQVRR